MNNKVKLLFFTFFLLFLLIIVFIFAFSVGSSSVSIKDLFSALRNKNSIEYDILIQTRLPRILLGIAVGGILSLSGLILQAIFKNPLVEPYTLGISGGAGLGVSLAIFFKLNKVLPEFTLTFFAFCGAFFVSIFLFFIKIKKDFTNLNKILLIGVMISFICSSLILVVLALSRSIELHAILMWMMGSLNESDNFLIYFTLVSSIIMLIISFFFTKELNAIQLGDDEAISLGINVNSIKQKLFIIVFSFTSISVAVAGIIGFVGLVIPLFTRLVFSRDYRINLVLTFLSGAIFLVLCDTIARTIISPVELPVGVITGIIGGTIFIYTLIKKSEQ